MKKFLVPFFVSSFILLSLLGVGQNDTIDMLPFARIVVSDGSWIEKNKQDNELMCSRKKLLNKINPTQSVRFKTDHYEETSLKELIEKQLQRKYGNSRNDDMETNFELVELRPDLWEVILTVKPNECTDDREAIFSMIGEGIEVHMFLLDLGNHHYLEIEPDNENFSVESFRELNAICKEIAIKTISLTPEKADSIAGFPVTRQQVEKAWNDCVSDTSPASTDLLLRKMYCLTPETIRDELQSAYSDS
ncbi:MAG: hypothetical protein ACKVOK_12255, partial [Flavobacteriales bacterium]